MVKKRFFIFLVILLDFLFISQSIYTKIYYEGSQNQWNNIYKINNLEELKFRNMVSYRIKENEREEDAFTDLIIHFNETKKENFRIIGNYKVSDLLYIPNIDNKVYGEASANFSLTHHKVKLLPEKNSILYPGNSIGNFTISFWVYPQASYEGNELLSYYSPAYNRVNEKIEYTGFKIFLIGNEVNIKFDNIFFVKNIPISFEINTGINLDIVKWQHIAFTYNKYSGKFICYKNNQKTGIFYFTDSGKEKGTLLEGKIPEDLRTYLIIGQSFLGNIDEFVIDKRIIDEFDLAQYKREGGYLISKVIDLNYYTSKVFKFETKSITENKTSLVIYYRIMEDFYDEDDGVIPWKQYETNAMIKGRYLQYKIIFFPSYEGRFSPQLLDFIITIIPNYPPSPPNNLQYKILNNSQVEIYWNKNIESDVIGYYLYYGTKSKFYICSDAVEGISPIFTEKNFIIITLRADTEYFVSVKAVDNAFYPQKSDFSNEIVFRTKN